MDYSQVPHELRILKQWLCVKLVPVPGKKPRKVPVKNLKTPASVDDPTTWVTFDEAVQTIADSGGKLHHIGFVFTTGDPYCGVDLDDCVNNDGISSEARKTIELLDSYTETSISGTGVHVIVRAEKPGAQCRKGKTEIYDQGRYFCFSGAVVDGRDVIYDRQESLDSLYRDLWPGNKEQLAAKQMVDVSVAATGDAVDILKAVSASSGLMQSLLAHGDWARLSVESASDADYIACCALAKATNGQRDLMDAAMRLSALMRPKWDEQRGDRTYGQRTIDAALKKWTEAGQGIAPGAVDPEKATHEKLAKATIAALTARLAAPPINHANELWICEKNLWRPLSVNTVTNLVAEEWDGTLKKQGDYTAVRKRIYEIIPVADGAVFNTQGFAFQDSIATVTSGGVVVEKLRPDHMASKCAGYAPAEGNTPCWDAFLTRSFAGVAGQIPLLQELFGLTLLGEMPRIQQCVLLHGPGATGKSVVLNVLTSLFPSELTCAVPPADWAKEYSRAEMTGKKLNVAGELSSIRSIQADIFKAVVAGDKISARRIYESTFSLAICAAHWFSANELPSTEDHTSGWYRRFVVIQMPNPVPSAERNTRLLNVLQKEKAGIAAWALEGAARYFLMGALSTPVSESGSDTPVGVAVLDEWRAERDSVAAWKSEYPDLAAKQTDEDKKAAYKHYRAWCFDSSGGQPCNLPRFKNRLKSL